MDRSDRVLGRVDRYLIRELTQSFVAVFVVLTMVSLSNALARYLVKIAEGRLGGEALFVLLALKSVKLLTVLVPLGLLLGVMLALGRFYRDSEMTALMACGFGPGDVYRAIALFGSPLVLGLTWFSLYGGPWAASLSEEFTHRAAQSAEITLASPGQFREMVRVGLVAYAEGSDPETGELTGVFLQRSRPERDTVVTGRRARQYIDPESGGRYLVLRHGQRTESAPGSAALTITEFEELSVLIDEGNLSDRGTESEEKPLAEIWGSGDLNDVAEVHWRIAPPVAALVLLLLAPPLAHARPREGRYGRLTLAILMFVVYLNLLGVGRVWIQRGEVGGGLGLWWVHGGVFLVMGMLLFRGHPYGLRLTRTSRASSASTG